MKKILASLLSIILLASSVPASCFAATDTAPATAAVSEKASASITKEEPASIATDPSDKALESAIKAVKEKITVPKEYSDFNYYFFNTNSYSDSYWSLTWTNPTTKAGIQINCNADNHITYYNKYDYSQSNTSIAKYLKNDLKATGEDFIKKIAPETANNLELVSSEYDSLYSGNYVYSYQRKTNGVVFPENTVSVSVSSVTGEVTGASVNWIYGVTVPSSATKLTKDDAAALIKKNVKMKLVYQSDYYRYYDSTAANPRKAFLVYIPTENYISVDAKTGEIYKTKSEWVEESSNSPQFTSAKMSADSSAEAGAQALTEEETAKVEELKNLISKSDAIKKVTGNKYLYLDKNLKAYTASLSKNYDGSDENSYVWYINLSDPREVNYDKDKDTYRAYAYATVDAKTGKILSYYSSLKSNYDETNQKWNTVKIKYNKEESRAILEKFFKSEISSYFTNSILSSQNDDYIAYYKEKDPVYGGYSYQYNRTNDGIEYPLNSINGSVDGVTGKIYSFGFNWDKNITFESSKGVMSADEAMNYYLANDGYGLKYEINQLNKIDTDTKTTDEYYDYTKAYSVDYEIRLVYRPDIVPAYISPFTGEQLNYNGEVFKKTKPYAYKDIDNSEKNRNILLLADMNIGFEGENFLPDQNITVSEINALLTDIGYGYYASSTDDSKNNNLITREAMAQMFVNKMGLEKLSKLTGIYSTGYNDANSIDSQYLGAVALTKGLGIMSADSNNNFNPKSNVTRFDAVNYILNFINAQQKGLY